MSHKPEIIDVRTLGAVGDGVADDSAAIQRALGSGNTAVHIPEGNYRIVSTLKVHSRTHVTAHEKARLFFCGEKPRHRGDFLLTNADTIGGNEDISIIGGTWDGGFGGKFAVKADDLFDPNACSGAVLNFINVKQLHLSDLIVANSVIYHVRMSRIEDFTIRNIGFFSERLAYNQDGLHFGGCVRNGTVENIRALSKGQTNDDLIALNADDSIERLENFDLARGDIENIVFKNIWAEDCFTAIRMASVTAAIRNIAFDNVYAGCRHFAINMDAARYCRTPLFNEADYPGGVGKIENVSINNMKVFFTTDCSEKAMILCETHVKNFKITNFERVLESDRDLSTPTFLATNVPGMSIRAKNGEEIISATIEKKDDQFRIEKCFSELYLNSWER